MNDSDSYTEDISKTNPGYFERITCDSKPWTKPFKCAVASCQNYFDKYIANGLPYKFHNFPKDSILKNIWLKKCSLPNNIKVDHIKVCSDHFLIGQYDQDYKEEFKNPNKLLLKSNAVPTEKLDGVIIPMVLDTDIKYEININDIKIAIDKNDALKKNLEVLKAKKVELQATLLRMKRKTKSRKTQINSIKINHAILKKKIGNKEYKNILSKVFSDAQVNVLNGESKTFWSNDDLAMAFTLRQMSSKFCYLYLKNTLNIPLPALSCVQKWAASK